MPLTDTVPNRSQQQCCKYWCCSETATLKMLVLSVLEPVFLLSPFVCSIGITSVAIQLSSSYICIQQTCSFQSAPMFSLLLIALGGSILNCHWSLLALAWHFLLLMSLSKDSGRAHSHLCSYLFFPCRVGAFLTCCFWRICDGLFFCCLCYIDQEHVLCKSKTKACVFY